MPLNPVFLSASVPDPHRDPKYFSTGDTIAIRDAVIALVTAVVLRTRLVFGGHPAITPMVKWVADRYDRFDRVRMFQSTFYRDKYIADVARFKYVEIAAAGSREQSLKDMREAMLRSERFSAAFFIGGMDGVEAEYRLVRELPYPVPCYPVATTGAAARILWEQIAPDTDDRFFSGLREKTAYTALFTRILDELETRG